MIPGKIVPGTIVEPISPNRGMAIFKSDSGGRFVRVKEENGIWRAITLLEYKGPGLVIFLSNINETDDLQQIGPGEVLRSNLKVQVTSVYDRHAVGEVISEPKCKSLEEAFNVLIDQIDTDNSKDEVEFGNEIFKKEDIPLLLKLQTAFHRYRTAPRIQEKKDGDRNDSAVDGDNEASNFEEDDV